MGNWQSLLTGTSFADEDYTENQTAKEWEEEQKEFEQCEWEWILIYGISSDDFSTSIAEYRVHYVRGLLQRRYSSQKSERELGAGHRWPAYIQWER